MTRFQFVLASIFTLVIVIGVVTFAFFSSGGSNREAYRVVMWGSLDSRLIDSLSNQMKIAHQVELNFEYHEKDVDTLNQELIEALAVGKGPDVILLPQDEILRNQDKIYPIPFSTFSQRAFLDTFIDEGNLYLSSTGVIGVPFVVDPLVMYWNRNLVTSAGFTKPPSTWSELFTQIPKLTVKDNAFNITTSAIAMGEWSNVRYSKEILSTLIMQSGNPITVRLQQNGSNVDTYKSVLSETLNQSVPPSSNALGFFIEFSNPAQKAYSWNRSLRDSQSAFLAGDLAYYLGFSSEAKLLRVKNPNLNYDMALLPQPLGVKKRTTFGKMQALAILKQSKHVLDAYALITTLTSAQAMKELTLISGLAPTRRDLLANPPSDPFGPIIYNSALFASGWFDPDKVKSDEILKQMTSEVITGNAYPSEAVNKASQSLDLLINTKK